MVFYLEIDVIFNCCKLHPCQETTTFIINCNGIYFSSQEQIAYFLTQEAVYLLVHFKFLRVQNDSTLACNRKRNQTLRGLLVSGDLLWNWNQSFCHGYTFSYPGTRQSITRRCLGTRLLDYFKCVPR